MRNKCNICGYNHYLKKLSNGYACIKCMKVYQGVKEISIEELKEILTENQNRLRIFKKEQVLSSFGLINTKIYLDYTNKMFYAENKIPIVFKFEEIETYSVQKVGEKQITKNKGGIARAIIGGAIAGPVGAIVGANTATQETQTSGGTFSITIHLNMKYGKYTFDVFDSPFELPKFLDECINSNKAIQEFVDTKYETLKKYKKLLDENIITAEEYNMQKRKILNIE